jgi:hypothetical protein
MLFVHPPSTRTLRQLALTLILARCIWPSLSPAEADGPDFYRVRDVSPDDVLNMREQPGAKSRKIGEIPADGRCLRNLGCQGGLTIEEYTILSEQEQKRVLRERPRWCKVDYQGRTGWVAGLYLAEDGCTE